MLNSKRFELAIVGFGILIVLLDQYLKLSAQVWVVNTGGVFGVEISNFFIIFLHIGLLILLGLNTYKSSYSAKYCRFVWLISVVSLSNLFDRIVRGGVVDYLDFHLFKANIADIVINLSLSAIIVLILVELWQNSKLKKRMTKED